MNERPAKDDANEGTGTETADADALQSQKASIERLTAELAAERENTTQLISAVQALASVVGRVGRAPSSAAASGDLASEAREGTPAPAPTANPGPTPTSSSVRGGGGPVRASTRGAAARGAANGAAEDTSKRTERKRARSEQRSERSAARRSGQRGSARGDRHATGSDATDGGSSAAVTSPAARASVDAAARPAAAADANAGAILDLNAATFEQLRQLGMSVTQATRVVAYRERGDGFGSVDDLAKMPGFPKGSLAELKQRLTV